jgi:hypothetical protein
VAKEGGQYRISYKGPWGTNVLILVDETLEFDARRDAKPSWFKITCKRLP